MSESPNQKLFKIKLEDRYVYKDENGKAVISMPSMTFTEILPGLYVGTDNTCKSYLTMDTYFGSDSPKNVASCLNVDSEKFNELKNKLKGISPNPQIRLPRIHPMKIIREAGRTVTHFNFIGIGDYDGYDTDEESQYCILFVICNLCKMSECYKSLPTNVAKTRNNNSIELKVLIANDSTSRNRHNTLEEKYILRNAKNFFSQNQNQELTIDFLNLDIFNGVENITDMQNHLTIYKNDKLNELGEKILKVLLDNFSEILTKALNEPLENLSNIIKNWLLDKDMKAALNTCPFETNKEDQQAFIDTIKTNLNGFK